MYKRRLFLFLLLPFLRISFAFYPCKKRRRWERGSRPAAYVVIMAYNDDYISCMHLHTDTYTRMLRCAELAYSCCSACRQLATYILTPSHLRSLISHSLTTTRAYRSVYLVPAVTSTIVFILLIAKTHVISRGFHSFHLHEL